jgi:hypothetical protein
MLTISDSLIVNNHLDGYGSNRGGGIAADSNVTLIIRRSEIADNTSLGARDPSRTYGGGIFLQSGFLTIEDSQITRTTSPRASGRLTDLAIGVG